MPGGVHPCKFGEHQLPTRRAAAAADAQAAPRGREAPPLPGSNFARPDTPNMHPVNPNQIQWLLHVVL